MKCSLQNRVNQELTFHAREHQIERVGSTRYRGVNFSKYLSWPFHNDIVVKKSLQKLAHIQLVLPAETKVKGLYRLGTIWSSQTSIF